MVAVVAAIASGSGRWGSWGGWFVVDGVLGGGSGVGAFTGRGIDCGDTGDGESGGKVTWIR